MSPELKRRLRIWGICLLIVVAVFAYIITHVTSRPSESLVSANIFPGTNLISIATRGLHTYSAINVTVSNRMSHGIDCLILADFTISGSATLSNIVVGSYSLGANSQKRTTLNVQVGVQEVTRWRVQYGRQLKPIEKSILKKLSWLERHYPFYRRLTIFINDPVTNVQVSNESKQQP